ncbi:MAG: DMT family transporter [Rhodospirillaceae bacterium]|nr:DMT family transporter [Rhodospirillaceae bacterium]
MPTSFLYIVAVLIGGVSWFPILFQLGVVPVEQSIAYRFLLSGALMLLFCLATGRQLTFTARQHLSFAAQGIVLFTACFLLFFYALSYLASGLLSVIYSTILVMNIVNGMIFFGHRSDRAVGIGAALGLVGIALVFSPEIVRFEAGQGALIGLGLALGATYAASLGNMVSVYHKAADLPVISTTAWAMTYGGIFTFLIALVVAPDFTFDPRLPYVGSLLFLVLAVTVIAFTAYLALVQRIGADRTAYIPVIVPVMALGLSVLFEDYRWGWVEAVGVLLVIVGNVIVLKAPKPLPAMQPAQ